MIFFQIFPSKNEFSRPDRIKERAIGFDSTQRIKDDREAVYWFTMSSMPHYYEFKVGFASDASQKLADLPPSAQLTLPGGLPRFAYDRLSHVEPRYDDFGRLVSYAGILPENLRIEPVSMETAVPLINADSLGPSKVTLNLAEYVQCLQAKVVE